jgi:hypothetical protein
VTPTCVLNLKCTFGDASRFNPGGSASRCACCQPCRARCLVHRGTDQCAIDPAATDQSKLGGQDSWTARWQKRTRREAFDRNDWFGGGIRRGPQSGCGQGSRIAGKQERSSSQVALQLSPDLEVRGRLRPSREGRWRRSGLECSAVLLQHEFGAACGGIVCVHLGLEGWKLLACRIFERASYKFPADTLLPAPWLGCFDQDAR